MKARVEFPCLEQRAHLHVAVLARVLAPVVPRDRGHEAKAPGIGKVNFSHLCQQLVPRRGLLPFWHGVVGQVIEQIFLESAGGGRGGALEAKVLPPNALCLEHLLLRQIRRVNDHAKLVVVLQDEELAVLQAGRQRRRGFESCRVPNGSEENPRQLEPEAHCRSRHTLPPSLSLSVSSSQAVQCAALVLT